jgi:AAA family ATP:ADP antiporter
MDAGGAPVEGDKPMKQFLYRALNVREGEEKLLILLWGVFFFMGASIIYIQSASSSLFLKFIGIEYLPLLFIAEPVIMLPISVGYTKLLDRVGSRKLVLSSFAVMGGVFLLSRLILLLGGIWYYPVLSMLVGISMLVLGTQSWSLAGEIYDIQASKRLFGVIGSGGPIGVILSGLTTKFLVDSVGTFSLLLVSSGFLLLCVLLISVIYALAPPAAEVRVKSGRKKKPQGGMKEGLHLLKESSYLRYLIGSTFTAYLLVNILTFLFRKSATETFASTDDLTAFFGSFEGFMGIFALCGQILLTSRILKVLGVGKASLVRSAGHLLGFGLISLYFSLLTTVIARTIDRVVLRILSGVTSRLLYNPLPQEHKEKIRAFVEWNVVPVASALSGLLILFADSYISVRLFGVIAFGISVGGFWLTLKLKDAYGTVFVENITKEDALSRRLGTEELFDFQDRSTIEALEKGVREGDEQTVLFSMELLAKIEAKEAVGSITTHLHSPHKSIRKAAVHTLGVLGTSQQLPAIAEMLPVEKDLGVLVALIDTFGKMAAHSVNSHADSGLPSDPAALPVFDIPIEEYVVTQLTPFLHSPYPAVKAAAIIQLVTVGGLDGVILSAEVLKQMLNDPKASEREQSAYILGELKIRSFFPQLLPLIHDQESTVQHRAIEALGKIQDSRAVQPLVDLLEQDLLRPTVLSALEQIAGQDCQPLVQAFQDSQLPRETRQHIPLLLKDTREAEVNTLLTTALADQHPLIQFQILSALTYRKKKGLITIIDQAPLKAFLRSMAETLCVYHLSRFRIAALPETLPAATLLRDHLSTRIRAGEECVFRALGLLYEAPMQSIYTSFRSSNATQRSYAIEAVQNVIEKDLQELLLPLLEQVPESEMAHFGEQQFALPRFTVPVALHRLLQEEDYWMNAVIYYVITQDKSNQFSELRTTLQNSVAFMEENAMLRTMDNALFLKGVPLFANLEVEDLFHLAQITEEQDFPSNTMIFQEGDMGDSLFLLLAGEVDVLRIIEQETHLLATLGPKDFFGEMAILTEEPRSASIRTRSPVTALVMEKEEFKGIMNRRPEIGQEIIRVLIARLKHTQAQQVG